MTKDETGFEVVEAKLAELYELQWDRLEHQIVSKRAVPDPIREEVAEAREILAEWLWCLEAKDRASRRIEGASAKAVTDLIRGKQNEL